VLTGSEVVERWKAHGLTVNGTGPTWRAQCGAHDDHDPSVSIRQVGDAVKVRCFVCHDRDSVLAAVGLTWRDITPSRAGGATTPTRPAVPPPATPKPKSDLDHVLDAFHAGHMTWRATARNHVWRAECPVCRDPSLSVWVFSYDDDERAGEPTQVTCANGCDEDAIARGLVAMRELLS
jgi:hypothetical protein